MWGQCKEFQIPSVCKLFAVCFFFLLAFCAFVSAEKEIFPQSGSGSGTIFMEQRKEDVMLSRQAGFFLLPVLVTGTGRKSMERFE